MHFTPEDYQILLSVLAAFSVGEMMDHFAYRNSKQSQETFIIKLQCVRKHQF